MPKIPDSRRSPVLVRIHQAWVDADEAAERLGELDMDPDRFRQIIDGTRKPAGLDLALIAAACRVSVDWLLYGYGTPPDLPESPKADPGNDPATESSTAVQVGWYCWRCHGINLMACRSDNVPILVPAEWAEDMTIEIAKRDNG